MALPPFSALLDAHGDELARHARRLTDADRAEDVLQEALLRALRAYPRLRHSEQLRAWLFRVVFTTAMDSHRAVRGEVLVAAVEPGFVGTEPGGVPAGPEWTAAEDPEARASFEALIAGLGVAAQAALRLRFVEDLSYEAIAARLGCSPAAARQRVSSAVRTLRERSIS